MMSSRAAKRSSVRQSFPCFFISDNLEGFRMQNRLLRFLDDSAAETFKCSLISSCSCRFAGDVAGHVALAPQAKCGHVAGQ